eukprot:gene13587-18237_t
MSSFETISSSFIVDGDDFIIDTDFSDLVCNCRKIHSSGRICTDSTCLNFATQVECLIGSCDENRCQNNRFQTKKYSKLFVQEVAKKGHGLFADENIERGAFVMEYVGELISTKELYRRLKGLNKRHLYVMQLKTGVYLDAREKGSISRFINHSCEPNCTIEIWTVDDRLRVGIFTLKNIQKGEELTFDYQWKASDRPPTVCYCGTTSCRGFLEVSTVVKSNNVNNNASLRSNGIKRGLWRARDDSIPSQKQITSNNSIDTDNNSISDIFTSNEQSSSTNTTDNNILVDSSGCIVPSSLIGKRIKLWWEGNQEFFEADVIGYDDNIKRYQCEYLIDFSVVNEDLEKRSSIWYWLDESQDELMIKKKVVDTTWGDEYTFNYEYRQANHNKIIDENQSNNNPSIDSSMDMSNNLPSVNICQTARFQQKARESIKIEDDFLSWIGNNMNQVDNNNNNNNSTATGADMIAGYLSQLKDHLLSAYGVRVYSGNANNIPLASSLSGTIESQKTQQIILFGNKQEINSAKSYLKQNKIKYLEMKSKSAEDSLHKLFNTIQQKQSNIFIYEWRLIPYSYDNNNNSHHKNNDYNNNTLPLELVQIGIVMLIDIVDVYNQTLFQSNNNNIYDNNNMFGYQNDIIFDMQRYQSLPLSNHMNSLLNISKYLEFSSDLLVWVMELLITIVTNDAILMNELLSNNNEKDKLVMIIKQCVIILLKKWILDNNNNNNKSGSKLKIAPAISISNISNGWNHNNNIDMILPLSSHHPIRHDNSYYPSLSLYQHQNGNSNNNSSSLPIASNLNNMKTISIEQPTHERYKTRLTYGLNDKSLSSLSSINNYLRLNEIEQRESVGKGLSHGFISYDRLVELGHSHIFTNSDTQISVSVRELTSMKTIAKEIKRQKSKNANANQSQSNLMINQTTESLLSPVGNNNTIDSKKSSNNKLSAALIAGVFGSQSSPINNNNSNNNSKSNMLLIGNLQGAELDHSYDPMNKHDINAINNLFPEKVPKNHNSHLKSSHKKSKNKSNDSKENDTQDNVKNDNNNNSNNSIPVTCLDHVAPEIILGGNASFHSSIYTIGSICTMIMTNGKPLVKVGQTEDKHLQRLYCTLGTPRIQTYPEFESLPLAQSMGRLFKAEDGSLVECRSRVYKTLIQIVPQDTQHNFNFSQTTPNNHNNNEDPSSMVISNSSHKEINSKQNHHKNNHNHESHQKDHNNKEKERHKDKLEKNFLQLMVNLIPSQRALPNQLLLLPLFNCKYYKPAAMKLWRDSTHPQDNNHDKNNDKIVYLTSSLSTSSIATVTITGISNEVRKRLLDTSCRIIKTFNNKAKEKESVYEDDQHELDCMKRSRDIGNGGDMEGSNRNDIHKRARTSYDCGVN